MIKKIVCFDFDNTLIHTPTPETGRPEWEKSTGLSWAGRGWWGNPESLNLNVFYPPVNGWVHRRYLEAISDPETYVFIATGRLIRLERQVKKVLDLHDIDCDLFCNNGGETFNFKCHLFEKMIEKYPKSTEFTMYDDRQEHLQRFVEWAKSQPIKVNIIDAVNKKQIF
jgi:hydroxymethylpyrimidine pyrophosphatase-like HAD family hydrolase